MIFTFQIDTVRSIFASGSIAWHRARGQTHADTRQRSARALDCLSCRQRVVSCCLYTTNHTLLHPIFLFAALEDYDVVTFTQAVTVSSSHILSSCSVVPLCVCICVCMRAYVHSWVCICERVHSYMCMYVCAYVPERICMLISGLQLDLYIRCVACKVSALAY